MDKKRIVIAGIMTLVFLAVWNGLAGIVDATYRPILHRFSTISTIALTIPANGDVNPYAVARVKHPAGNLKEGHLLVSNFNVSARAGAKGAAILDVAPDGSVSVFSEIRDDALPKACPGGAELSSGIVILRDGWVIVGAMPAGRQEGTRSHAGCLIVLDSWGTPVDVFSGSLIDGPRGLAAYETDRSAKLFVTNLLNTTVDQEGAATGPGNVVRINLGLPTNAPPRIESMTVVASGFPVRTDPDALLLGPVSVGLSRRCGSGDENSCPDYAEGGDQVLYVADSLSNRIAAIENPLDRTTSAGAGQTLSSGGSLNDPLALLVGPNGNILTINGRDGFIIEITPEGRQVAKAFAGQYRNASWGDQIETESTL